MRTLLTISLLIAFTGCASVNPLKNAPPSSAQPWESAKTESLAKRLQSVAPETSPAVIDPSRTYTLPELVDLAQRSNRATRAAWQTTREAAIAVGLSQAEFYPMLAVLASFGGGYWDLDMNLNNSLAGVPLPNNLVGAVFGSQLPKDIDLNLSASGAFRMLNTGAALRWMLFDFGERHAKMTQAQQMQIAANLSFNAVHQEVAMKVLESYYAWEAAKREQEAAATTAEATRKLALSAVAKAEQGLLTKPLLLQAKQAEAEADYALQSAQAQVEMKWIDMAEALGISPGTNLKISKADFSKLQTQLQKPLDAYISAAVAHRPDLLAKVAVVQAKEAELRAARANLLPKLSLEGVAGYTRFDTSVQTSGPLNEMGFGLQTYGGFLTVQWPLFTGFGLENQAKLAETQRQAAVEELALAKEKSISEVWRAYTQAKNALASRESAAGLVKANRETYEASLAGFEQGLVPIQDVLAAQASWAKANALFAKSECAIGTTMVALIFTSGQLNAKAFPKTTRPQKTPPVKNGRSAS